ncbi:hypothetical protein LCGC14_1351400 [marine sediment metagenome]|uniref:GRAM domain-containing protein n=1 Tax=marine sediment metagenome TaxID=412755 RepID=A0A0F9MRL5_9ZZZZ
MNEMSDVKTDIKYYFDAKKGPKTTKRLVRCLKKSELPLEETLDLLGELMRMDNVYFMEKIYPILVNQTKYSPILQNLDVDKYMLEKFCMIQGETFLAMGNAKISESKTITSGKIFVTNYRIIMCGEQVVRSAQATVKTRPHLIGSIMRSGITHKRKALRKAITKALSSEISNFDIVEWGYYFPISYAQNIKRTDKMISYFVKIETEKKNIKMKLKITPKKLKKQPKLEFQEQGRKLLDQIEELLVQNQ